MLEIMLVPTWCPDTEIWLQLFYIVNQSNALELIHVKKIQFKYNLTFKFSKSDIFLHIVQLLYVTIFFANNHSSACTRITGFSWWWSQWAVDYYRSTLHSKGKRVGTDGMGWSKRSPSPLQLVVNKINKWVLDHKTELYVDYVSVQT